MGEQEPTVYEDFVDDSGRVIPVESAAQIDSSQPVTPEKLTLSTRVLDAVEIGIMYMMGDRPRS